MKDASCWAVCYKEAKNDEGRAKLNNGGPGRKVHKRVTLLANSERNKRTKIKKDGTEAEETCRSGENRIMRFEFAWPMARECHPPQKEKKKDKLIRKKNWRSRYGSASGAIMAISDG